MEKLINYENLRNFAYSNDKNIEGEIKGIVLVFEGLGSTKMYDDREPGDALELARKGILYVLPYYNPWCWMNRQTVRFVDEIIDVLCDRYSIDKDRVNIVSTGRSMGGLCALVYCAYSRLTPAACVTNCPVCDLLYHFGERPDLPRTLYSAFFEYEGSMDEALRSASPLHIVDKLPKIPYSVFHCEADKAVDIDMHSRRFVEAMRPEHDITLKTIPLRGHCDLSAEMSVEYLNTIVAAALK